MLVSWLGGASWRKINLPKLQVSRLRKSEAILVYGIGEQRRFEHLEGETRKIVDAIIARYGARRRDVTPVLTTGPSDAFLGAPADWVSGGEAPLRIVVELPDTIVDIGFHEVWWADINEKLTIGKQIKFWAWDLSLAGIATHNNPFVPGASHTRPPRNAGALSFHNRIRMGYISALFGLSAFSIALINLVLKRSWFFRTASNRHDRQLSVRGKALQPREAHRRRHDGRPG